MVHGTTIDRTVIHAVFIVNDSAKNRAFRARKKIRGFTSLAEFSERASVTNRNLERALGVGHPGSAVLGAEITVTGAGLERLRRGREPRSEGDVSAVATAMHGVHSEFLNRNLEVAKCVCQ